MITRNAKINKWFAIWPGEFKLKNKSQDPDILGKKKSSNSMRVQITTIIFYSNEVEEKILLDTILVSQDLAGLCHHLVQSI